MINKLKNFWSRATTSKKVHRVVFRVELGAVLYGVAAVLTMLVTLGHAPIWLLQHAFYATFFAWILQTVRRHYGFKMNYNAVAAVLLGEEHSKFR